MKIHLDTGNICYNNLNLRESIYSFLNAQQNETKKFIDFDLDIADVTDDKFDNDAHSTSKFLFYYFNSLRCHLGEEPYKVRHTTFFG